MKTFIVFMLAICIIAIPAFAMDFPSTLQAGKYTLEVPKESAPWTIFDNESMIKTKENIIDLKLTIEFLSKKAQLDSKYSALFYKSEIDRAKDISKIQLDLMQSLNDDLKERLKKETEKSEFLGISKFTWGIIIGSMLTSAAIGK